MSDAPTDPPRIGGPVGPRVGRFVLVSHLGDGGLGTVWRAYDPESGEAVAIKRLHPELARDERLRRRLAREVRAVGRLRHPHVVNLLDTGATDDGAPWYVMPLVPGVPLSTWAETLPRLPDVRTVFAQVLGALAEAHAAGVVHRDLGPGNVLVAGPPGAPHATVLDFGFAQVEDDIDDQITAIYNDRFGQPSYMAPEQVAGETDVGPAADLYAVAVLLWEVLTGAPPFSGSTGTAVLMQHLSAALPAFEPRRRAAPEVVPEAIEAVLRRALAKRPETRHRDAQQLAAALDLAWQSPAATPPAPAPLSPAPQPKSATWAHAETLQRAGDASGALRLWSAVAYRYRAEDRPVDAARAELRRGRLLVRLDRAPEADAAFAAAEVLAEGARAADRAALARGLRAWAAHRAGHAAERDRHLSAAIVAARDANLCSPLWAALLEELGQATPHGGRRRGRLLRLAAQAWARAGERAHASRCIRASAEADPSG